MLFFLRYNLYFISDGVSNDFLYEKSLSVGLNALASSFLLAPLPSRSRNNSRWNHVQGIIFARFYPSFFALYCIYIHRIMFLYTILLLYSTDDAVFFLLFFFSSSHVPLPVCLFSWMHLTHSSEYFFRGLMQERIENEIEWK